MKLILASQSPRRQQLLTLMGLTEFDVRPAHGEELADPTLSPDQLVEVLSRRKALEVAASAEAEDVILAADTVVSIHGRVLGKPRDRREAQTMLRLLSGETHTVYTGFTVLCGTREVVGHEATEVVFRPLSEEEIDAYVATGEPMDKAGAYGIQGRGCVLVERISGDYFNVIGLPVCRLAVVLRQFGLDVLSRE